MKRDGSKVLMLVERRGVGLRRTRGGDGGSLLNASMPVKEAVGLRQMHRGGKGRGGGGVALTTSMAVGAVLTEARRPCSTYREEWGAASMQQQRTDGLGTEQMSWGVEVRGQGNESKDSFHDAPHGFPSPRVSPYRSPLSPNPNPLKCRPTALRVEKGLATCARVHSRWLRSDKVLSNKTD